MVGWHHRLDGHGSGWTPGVGDGQGMNDYNKPDSQIEQTDLWWLQREEEGQEGEN